MKSVKSITLGMSLVLLLVSSSAKGQQPELVSANRFNTGSGNDRSQDATMSANGRHVAFYSHANNLVPNDTNGQIADAFVRDLLTDQTTLVSINHAGTGSGNDGSYNPVISADGRYIVFSSEANDLVGNDTNNYDDVFVRDLVAGTTTLVSVNAAGWGSGNDHSYNRSSPVAMISADGRYVVFHSDASDLVANDTNGSYSDVFVRDLIAGKTTLVSVDRTGSRTGNHDSHYAAISANGRFVVFESLAGDLVSKDFNGSYDIYMRDMVAGKTSLVSINHAGTASGNGHSYFYSMPMMTPDGRFVAFISRASDLVTNDISEALDVYVRDVVAGTTELVSVNRTGTSDPHWYGWDYSISANGRYVAFVSGANDLVENDGNNHEDVFVRDLVKDKTTLVSVNSVGKGGNRPSSRPFISADGRFIVFESSASDLSANDTNGFTTDVFFYDRATKSTTLLSVNHDGTGSGRWPSNTCVISSNHRSAAFQSRAGNLASNDHRDNLDVFAVSLAAGSIQFNVPVFRFSENSGMATITVRRTGGSRGAVSVDFATSDGSATAGQDYTAVSGTLNFADGEMVKTLQIPISDDSIDEPSDTVNLSLSHPTGGALLGARSVGVLAIRDDDSSSNPLVINFEEGTNGKAIDSHYAKWGVNFSNARFVSSDGHFGSSNLSLAALRGPGPSTPIIIVFKTPVKGVRLTGVDLSRQGFLLRSYDIHGNFIATAGYSDGGSNGLEIVVGAEAPPTIKRIEVYQPQNTHGTSGGLILDNLIVRR